MQLSYNGKKALELSEGLKLKAYKDSGGVWTIGIGTIRINGKPVQEGMTCTPEQAYIWLDADTATVQTCINKVVKVPLTQNQFDALVNLVYNIGEMAFMKSTLLKMLNMGMYAEAAKQFLRWDKDNGVAVKGLTARRVREKAMFES